MFTELASDFQALLHLEQDVMPPIEKHLEIRDADMKVKETIMIGVQQSSLGHFTSPAGSHNFFKPEDAPKELQNWKGTKRPNKSHANNNNKKITTGTKWLGYKGKGLPKFPDLKHGRVCKSYVVQGFTCNHGRTCRFDGHVYYNQLKQDDKERMDNWVANSHDLFYIEG